MNLKTKIRICVFLYLAAIITGNLVIAWVGPSAVIVVAFACIGLDLTTRDTLHDAWRGSGLLLRMALLIAAGSLLSWFLNRNAGPIALASFVAFALAASADGIAYAVLGKRARLIRVNGSNVVGAAVDSLVFPTLAFGRLLPWVVAGQFIAKVAGGAVWSFLLTALGIWEKEKQPNRL